MRKLALAVIVLGAALSWLFAKRAERSAAADAPEPALRAVEETVELAGATAASPGERETVSTEIARDASDGSGPGRPEPPSFVFCGIARDALSGRPVEGARAVLTRSRRTAWPSELEPEEIDAEAASDAAGRFRIEIPLPSRRGPLAHLAAAGYGPERFLLDSSHGTRERAEVIDLLPAAELDVHVTGADGSALEWVNVAIQTVRSVGPGQGLARGDFELPPLARAEHTDASGVAHFDGLGAETELAWTVRDPARPRWREGRLALAPGERRGLEVVLGGDARVSGRVVDEHGAPVPELDVFLAPQSNRTHHGDSMRMLQASSDSSGAFEFSGVPFDSYVLGFRADEDAFVAHTETLEVDRAELERDLHLVHGRMLSGVVSEPALGWAVVYVRSLDGTPRLDSGLDGSSFRVGPLPEGEYLVSACDGERSTAVVRAAAGTSDLELAVMGAREVEIQWFGARGPYDVRLVDLEHAAVEFWREEGVRTSRPLSPGAYGVLAATDDGAVGFVPRFLVAADAGSDAVAVDVRPGAYLTLVHRASDRPRGVRLRLDGALLPLALQGLDELAPGASETVLVPAGEYTAELLEGEQVVDTDTTSVVPGERHRFVLEPR